MLSNPEGLKCAHKSHMAESSTNVSKSLGLSNGFTAKTVELILVVKWLSQYQMNAVSGVISKMIIALLCENT